MKLILAAVAVSLATGLACGRAQPAPDTKASQPPVVQSAVVQPAVVLGASATSYGEGASPVTCLLDAACSGAWTPRSKDAGVNEGLYIQFKEPVPIGYIDIVMEGRAAEHTAIVPYLDGRSSSELMHGQGFGQRFGQQRRTGGSTGATENTGEEYGWEITSHRLLDENTGDIHVVVSRFNSWGGVVPDRGERPVGYKARSVYLRLVPGNDAGPPRVKAVRFFADTGYGTVQAFARSVQEDARRGALGLLQPGTDPIALQLPLAPKATVTATSVLEPAIAYDPSHLFDSQLDMAWSTDGRKTSGIGSSVTVRFDGKQDIQGLMLWNGYQRSDAHHKANGRVRTLAVGDEALAVRDTPGVQTLLLKKPVDGDSLTLTIKDIYKGDAYKDVLISELRFLTPDGRIVLPRVELPAAEIPPDLAPRIDRTYAAFIQRVYRGDGTVNDESGDSGPPTACSRASLRLRSNGTFVVYTDFLDGKMAARYQPGVIEGNWEPQRGGVRLFGKKYRIPVQSDGGYLSPQDIAEKLPALRIFQSRVKIGLFNDLTEAEQKNILAFLIDRRLGRYGEGDQTAISLSLTGDEDRNRGPEQGQSLKDSWSVFGETLKEAQAKLLARVRALDPLYVKSDVFTDLLLPQDRVSECLR